MMPQVVRVGEWVAQLRHARRSMMALAAIVSLLVVVASACSGVPDNGTDRGVVETQTARAQQAPSPAPAGSPGAAASPGGGGGNADAGAQLAIANGCTGCHSINGSTLVGPTWQGLAGAQVQLDNGQTVTADAAYLRESILNPGAKVVKGFSNIMPPFQGRLSAEQVDSLIAYIETLK